MARYKVLQRSFINNKLVDEGEEVEYEGVPGANLSAIDKDAKAAATRTPRLPRRMRQTVASLSVADDISPIVVSADA